MREAVGSTFLFKLMIFFIFFFASFLAIAINYSQAFSIKNQIINILEKSEGLNSTSIPNIVDVTINSGYHREVDCIDRNDGESITDSTGGNVRTAKGVCIQKLPSESDTANRYYKVTTYVSFNFPIIGNIITFPVRGETKVIRNLHED